MIAKQLSRNGGRKRSDEEHGKRKRQTRTPTAPGIPDTLP
jgi:hypothetical protein